MMRIDSLTFELADYQLHERDAEQRLWVNPVGVFNRLRFLRRPPSWPFDLTTPDVAHEFYRRQCESAGGAMLSATATPLAGSEALCGLFKYRAPAPHNLAIVYVGILWLPFQTCNYQLNVEAGERGTTGVREATVMAIEGDAWPRPPVEKPPETVSAQELMRRLGSSPLRRIPSDEEKYDAAFPHHPLSQVRARLAEIIATARLATGSESPAPFRIGRVPRS